MGLFSPYTSAFNNSALVSRSPASSPLNYGSSIRHSCGRTVVTRTQVASSHSNHKILKLNRRTRYGQPLSTYDADEEADVNGENDWFSDDDFGEVEISEADRQRLNSKNLSRQGAKVWDFKSSRRSKLGTENGKRPLHKNKLHHLSEEMALDERYFPLLNYLNTFGFEESHFIRMYERHMPSLQINVESAQERLNYLLNVGVKHGDVRKILLRQPQILEYTVENNLKLHVSFLTGLGIPDAKIGQIITATPSIFSYSVEHSLKPTVEYLKHEVGIQERNISKVVQLSPQILVQRIEISWNGLVGFLMNELSAPRQSIVKMVIKHPQILHYSIENGLLPRINFLRSVGMQNGDILKVLTSLTQVVSLSLERNLKPKYLYLINELRNEVRSLTKYPMYLSLSLDQRIKPRHQFLISLKKAPKGPFPLSSFVPTDECFCKKWAGTSVDHYLDFRHRLLLNDFAKKYERR